MNTKNQTINENSNTGFAAIVSVLLISTVLLAIVATEVVTSIGEMQSSLSVFQGEDTLNLVEGCVEDALLLVRNNASYNGSIITRPEGTCNVAVSKVSTTWTLTVSPVGTKHNRTIEVVIDRTTAVNLVSWKEI